MEYLAIEEHLVWDDKHESVVIMIIRPTNLFSLWRHACKDHKAQTIFPKFYNIFKSEIWKNYF